FVEGQVKELLGIQPLIFTVSAREALKHRGEATTDGDVYGVDTVRAHLRGVFNEAPLAKQKLLAQLDMAQSISARHLDTVRLKVNSVGSDASKAREVQQELQQQSLGLDVQLQAAREEIDKVFAGIRERGMRFLNTNLSVRLLGRAPSKDKLQTEFQEVVIGRALRDINEATNNYVNAVIDQSRLYWRGVIERLSQLQASLEQNAGGLDAGAYAQQREGLQEATRIAESELKTYSTGTMIDSMQTDFEADLNAFKTGLIAAVGGLIVLVVSLSSLLPGGLAVGALAAPALLAALPITALSGMAVYRAYQKMTVDTKRDFTTRVDGLEQRYREALDELTRKERSRLSQYGTQVLTPIFSHLETLDKQYSKQQQNLQEYTERILALRKSIEATK
ncbi:MAG: hypothetical protein H7Y11_03465, partial [Armatimonadetes bacterium]|nr:hypothetical protein [Anaerolineae bacterium]